MEHLKETFIQELVEKYLEAACITATVDTIPLSELKVLIKILAKEDQGYLIGRQGAVLEALQHLISVIARKERSEIQYRVDVNNYQEDQDQLFIKRVTEYVDGKEESTEVLLWPMTAYERRLVHEHYLDQGTHATESEDFGSRRVVRIKKK